MILFYTKTSTYIWNDIYEEINQDDIKKRFKKQDSKGFYTTIPLHAPGETKDGESGKDWNGLKPPKGRHWRCSLSELDRLQNMGLIEWSKNNNPRKKVYASECKGKKIQDIWEFKDSQSVLYPTQKNALLLQRIIKMSSNPNSLVMDCFCGSGSFLKESFLLDRRFIGIDESEEAIKINRKWLENYQTTNLYACEYSFLKCTNYCTNNEK